MRNQQILLNSLLQITENLIEQAKEIQTNIKDNETQQLENVQILVDKREQSIQQLDAYMKQQQDFQWTQEEQQTIRELKTLEHSLQPLMNNLYDSFLKQMDRIHQTKQVSKKYFAAYQTISTDGSFIDKRK